MDYEQPIVQVSDDAAEAVYASGSGSLPGDLTPGVHQIVADGDCWSIEVTKDQSVANEGWCTFRVIANHSRQGQHLSNATTITVTFNQTISSADFEGFGTTVNGSVVVGTRNLLGDSYGSGDNYNSLLKIWCADPAGCQPVSYEIKCSKSVNVQGNGGDE